MFLGFGGGWCYYRSREPNARCESGRGGGRMKMMLAMWGVKRCTWS